MNLIQLPLTENCKKVSIKQFADLKEEDKSASKVGRCHETLMNFNEMQLDAIQKNSNFIQTDFDALSINFSQADQMLKVRQIKHLRQRQKIKRLKRAGSFHSVTPTIFHPIDEDHTIMNITLKEAENEIECLPK